MKARSITLATTLGLAACGLPGWMSAAFAQAEAPPSAGRALATKANLARALEHARAIGKPLLVIVAPASDPSNERGRAWGRYLSHAKDADMALLALCHVVCASRDDVAKLLGEKQLGPGEPWAVLVDRLGDERPAKRVEPKFKPAAEDAVALFDRDLIALDKRVEALANALRVVIAPRGEALQRLADLAVAAKTSHRLGDPAEIAIEDIEHEQLALIDAFAAWVLAVPEQVGRESAGDALRSRIEARLAQAARARLFERDLDGAAWERTFQDPCPPCGMALVPHGSQRFLRFFTAPEAK